MTNNKNTYTIMGQFKDTNKLEKPTSFVHQFTKFIFGITLLFGIFCGKSWGQTIVTIGGGATVTCPATPTATYTTPPTGVTFSNWSRGSGAVCSSNATSLRGTFATASATAAAALTANQYFSITITADALHTVTLNSLTWLTTLAGSCSMYYSNNGGATTLYGTGGQTGTATNTFTANVSVAAGTSLVLYFVPYAMAAGATCRITNGSTITVTSNSTVTFNPSGGSITTTTQTASTATALTSAATLGLSKAGYTFGGWATSAANATAGTVAYADGASYPFTAGAATLYAIWNTTVTFNASGGTITTTTQTANVATNLTAAATLVLARTGYTFGGWATSAVNATAGTVAYTNGASYPFTGGAATLYAIWIVSPTISVQPATAASTYCLNATATALSVTAAAGSGTISTYQWYSNTTATTTGGTAVGTNSNVYTPLTTLAGTLYYYVIITNSNGGNVTSNVSGAITVRAAFTTGTISSTGQSICSGGTPTVIGSTTAASGGNGVITYSWRSSADGYVAAIALATAATYTPPAGLTTTTSYQRYAKDGTCNTTPTVSSGTWTVTVVALPTITSALTSAVCSGTATSISLTASAPSTFAWTLGTNTGAITGALAGSGSTIAQTLTNPSATANGSIIYRVTPTTITGACAGTRANVTVTVYANAFATGTISSTGQTICSGGTPTVIGSTTAASGGNGTLVYSWRSSADGYVASIGGATAATYTPPAGLTTTTSYRRYANDGSCFTTPTVSAGTWTVTVNPLPSLTTATTATVCSGNATNISLTASVASTFAWTLGANTGAITGATATTGTTIAQTLTNPSTSAAGSIIYVVTPTSTVGTCVGAATNITVTVNPKPAVTTAATATVCSGSATNISLTASATSTYAWTLGANTGAITGATASSGTSIAQSLTNPSTTTVGSIVYAVTPTSTSGSCVGNATNITVSVYVTPSITTAATASVCSGTATNISLAASSASTYAWTLGTNTGAITGATASSGTTIAQTLTNPSNTTAGSIVYAVTPTSTLTGTCAGAATNIAVTVNPKPVVTTTTTTSIATVHSPNITLSASVPSTFAWTLGTNTGGITGASASSGPVINQVLTNPSTTTAGSIVYRVTPTATTGSCVGNATDITVTVGFPTTFTSGAIFTAGESICSGGTPSVIGNSIPSSGGDEVITYSWRSSADGYLNAILGATSSTYTPPAGLTTTTSYKRYAHDGTYNTAFTASTGIWTVTVNSVPSVTTAATATVCSGNASNISLTASVSSTFSWTLGANTGSITGATASTGSSIAQTLTNPSNSTAGSIVYAVTPTATIGSCVGATTNITVTINPTPTVTTSTSATICSGNTTNINLTASAASNYAWTLGTNTGSITGAIASSGSSIAQALTNPSSSSAGSIIYVVTPTSVTGTCVGSATNITVSVNPAFEKGTIASSGETICSGGTPTLIGISNAASGGDGVITYSWRSSADGYNAAIVSASSSTYTPPAGLTNTTSYRRYVNDGTCNTSPVSSNGTWTVTVNQPSSNPTSATASSTSIALGGSSTLTLNGGGSGSSETVKWYTGSAGGVLAATGNGAAVSPTSTTTYYGRYENGAPCSVNTTSASVTITVTAVWSGAFSTSWNDASNWTNSVVPSSGANITVNTGTYQPQLSGNVIVNNLLLNTGSSLNLNGNTLTVNGLVSGDGTFTGSPTSSLTLAGASAAIKFTSGNKSLNNLTINGDVTLGGTLDLYGVLYPNAGTFTTGGFLTLKNTSYSQNAMVATVTGNISGVVTAERYIPQNTNFRPFIDLSPIVYGGSIFDNWQEGGINTNGYGLKISGIIGIKDTADAVKGFDASQKGNGSMQTFTNGVWAYPTNTKTMILDPTMGYRVLARGNRAQSLFTTPQPTFMSSDVRLRATGTLITGDVTYTTSGVTSTNGFYSSNHLNTATGGFSFIGNPFASTVSWSNILAASSGITYYYYYLDPNVRSGTNTSTYISYIDDGTFTGTGTNSNGSSVLSDDIQPGQGFFIKQDGTGVSPQVVIPESAKTIGHIPTQIFGTKLPLNKLGFNLWKTGRSIDGAVATFRSDFSTVFGKGDCPKLMNSGENLIIAKGKTQLSICGLTLPTIADTIYLQFTNSAKSTNYRLSLNANQFDANGLTTYLNDSYLKTTTQLSSDSTFIDFTSTNDSTTNVNRFYLSFASSTLPVSSISLKAKGVKNSHVLLTWESLSANISSFVIQRSVNGKDYVNIVNLASSARSYTDSSTLSGQLYYRIKAINNNKTLLFSDAASISIDMIKNGILVYPNPVIGSYINVELNQAKKGSYTVQLFSVLGKRIFSEVVVHQGGPFIKPIPFKSNIPKGIYFLKLIGTDEVFYQQELSVK